MSIVVERPFLVWFAEELAPLADYQDHVIETTTRDRVQTGVEAMATAWACMDEYLPLAVDRLVFEVVGNKPIPRPYHCRINEGGAAVVFRTRREQAGQVFHLYHRPLYADIVVFATISRFEWQSATHAVVTPVGWTTRTHAPDIVQPVNLGHGPQLYIPETKMFPMSALRQVR